MVHSKVLVDVDFSFVCKKDNHMNKVVLRNEKVGFFVTVFVDLQQVVVDCSTRRELVVMTQQPLLEVLYKSV